MYICFPINFKNTFLKALFVGNGTSRSTHRFAGKAKINFSRKYFILIIDAPSLFGTLGEPPFQLPSETSLQVQGVGGLPMLQISETATGLNVTPRVYNHTMLTATIPTPNLPPGGMCLSKIILYLNTGVSDKLLYCFKQ